MVSKKCTRVRRGHKVIDKVFDTYAEKFHIIAHQAGHCGGLLYRIIAHNSKFYWHEDLAAIQSNQNRKNSLDWPDHDIGYMYDVQDVNGKNLKEQQLTAVHVHSTTVPNLVSNPESTPRAFRQFYTFLKKAEDKIVCLRTHDMKVHEKYPKVKVIRVCGSFSSRGDQYTNSNVTYPISEENVINSKLENILSLDYKTFETEYFKLCHNLKIRPTPIPVRGYILNYLDRLNNHKNKVIPRVI